MSIRRAAPVLALLVAGGVVAALFLGGGSPSQPSAADGTSTAATASVERRDLVEADTQEGTLSYADPQTVYDRLSGTITWLPAVGETIKPGGVLFRADGAPVLLLDGTSPAYRDLVPGITDGQDILQLNRNLVALGFDPDWIAPDDEWQVATTAGVEQLQRSLGEAQTGKVTLGQVVFLPGEQLVSGVDGTLGGGGSSGSGSPSAGNASLLDEGGRREYVSSQTPPPTPGETSGTTNPEKAPVAPGAGKGPGRVRTLEAQIARLKAELSRLKSAGSGTPSAGEPKSNQGSSSPSTSEGGSGGATPTAILQTTSMRLVVTVALEASKQREARKGEAVTVALPDGETVDGTVTAVSSVAQTPSANAAQNEGGGGSEPPSSTIPVTITLHGHHLGAGLDRATVSVNFARAVAHDVLSVPVTALVATGGAGYAVQEAAPPYRVIPVTTGLFAAGDVQISGAGIHPGLKVSDSQG